MGTKWVTTCTTCVKRSFLSRADANREAKRIPGPHLVSYRCPGNDDMWHLGHTVRAVSQGHEARGSYVPNRVHAPERILVPTSASR